MDHFQKSIYDAEEHLQAARRLYNSNVSLYNQKIVMFPYSVVARIHGMYKADFYEVDENKKEYLIPAIGDVVIDVDIEKQVVKIRPLRGIFEDED